MPAGASAAATSGKLTHRLSELAGPDLRNASAAAQADAVDLPRSGPASLQHRGGGVVVEIPTRGTPDSAIDALRAAGADIIHVSDRYDTVTASVALADLKAVSAVDGVRAVVEALAPMVAQTDAPVSQTGLNTCATGTPSEGDATLNANDLRAPLDVAGAGVKVGVLSDSYNRAGTTPSVASNVA